MRPVRLEVEGFTAFRGPTVVDFDSVDLFALVGPTGAGKTSIIDALTFALYGSVPRLDDRRAVAPVISQNLNEARVRLDFTVDGVPHTAARVVRATKGGGATTKEARLEARGEVVAGTADEVTAAVTERLGLTFEHFTTCVSLPQGQFARFLHDKPRSRQDLLVRLLDLGLYDRVASAARQRGALARNRADVVGGQLARLGGATAEARAAAERRATQLAALGRRLADEKPALDELAGQAVDADEKATALAEQVALLEALAAPPGVDELAASLVEADEARRQAAELDEEAVAAVTAAEERLTTLPDRSLLDDLLAGHRRRDELVVTAERGAAAEAEATARLEAAAAAEDEARRVHAERQAALERVRVELRAQALVPELVVGEACPVCRQDVHTLPDAHHPPDLAAAEQAVAAADKALLVATRQASEARSHQARVDEKLLRVRAEIESVEARLTASSTALRATLAAIPTADAGTGDAAGDVASGIGAAAAGGAGAEDGADASGSAGSGDGAVASGDAGAAERTNALGDAGVEGAAGAGGTAGDEAGPAPGWLGADEVGAQLERVVDAESALDKARLAERQARRARTEADRRHATIVDREREARRAFDAARDRVAALGPPAADRRDLAADWQGLLAWAADRRPALVAEVDGHRSVAEKARTSAAALLGDLVGACRDAGVEPGPGAWPGEAVAAAHARAEEQVVGIDAQIAEAERLRAEERTAVEDQQVADSLAGHLAANHFEKWLLDEAVHQLVDGATGILDELSGGAYALAVDPRSGGFLVVDHTNASQSRPARTLSGGETFLASLALALALADQVAGLAAAGAARLEALFLDEGFGTLDPDTLDVVAAALDELGARGRMVGVVTHVRELAERLPVRFEVRKVGGSATVERVDV